MLRTKKYKEPQDTNIQLMPDLWIQLFIFHCPHQLQYMRYLIHNDSIMFIKYEVRNLSKLNSSSMISILFWFLFLSFPLYRHTNETFGNKLS